jgi:aryl-alcohol dehydrogenase-like predicted oxidoreductase
MNTAATLGGSFTTAEGLTLTRMGYGAMQLAGPGVWGPPADRDEAIRVLRAAVEAGVNTSTPPTSTART